MILHIISEPNKFYGFCPCGALLDMQFKCIKKCSISRNMGKKSPKRKKYSGRSHRPFGLYEQE